MLCKENITFLIATDGCLVQVAVQVLPGTDVFQPDFVATLDRHAELTSRSVFSRLQVGKALFNQPQTVGIILATSCRNTLLATATPPGNLVRMQVMTCILVYQFDHRTARHGVSRFTLGPLRKESHHYY